MLDRKSIFQKCPGAHLLQQAQKYIPEPASTLYLETKQKLEEFIYRSTQLSSFLCLS